MTSLSNTVPTVILASASPSRAHLLTHAGLKFTAQPAGVNETAVKDDLSKKGAQALDAATALAELKAVTVSRDQPEALVIGADQILDLDGEWFDKPKDLDHARRHLETLRGKTHTLATATVVALDGKQVWQTHVCPQLTMRAFTDEFLDRYISTAGQKILSSVGAYQLEGLGAHLFSHIEGDFFSILGLPLMPLLDFLRQRGAVPA